MGIQQRITNRSVLVTPYAACFNLRNNRSSNVKGRREPSKSGRFRVIDGEQMPTDPSNLGGPPIGSAVAARNRGLDARRLRRELASERQAVAPHSTPVGQRPNLVVPQ